MESVTDEHIQAQYIYLDSEILAPFFCFAELVLTGLARGRYSISAQTSLDRIEFTKVNQREMILPIA